VVNNAVQWRRCCCDRVGETRQTLDDEVPRALQNLHSESTGAGAETEPVATVSRQGAKYVTR